VKQLHIIHLPMLTKHTS